MKIVISGGGIAGLTLAIVAKKAGHIPIVLEQRDALDKPSFGGGIGLWPPSQMVMERIGILDQLQSKALYMPSACYYDSKGYILGHPSKSFANKFPVACLEREHLLKTLYKKSKQLNIEILSNTSLNNVQSSKQGVSISLSNGQQINAKYLIGADGIGSKVRNIIMKQSGLPDVVPFHCQYAYFRAVLDIKSGDSEWHKHAFQSWGERRRFGYVPLKEPKTFWFVAIPIGQAGLQKMVGSHTCTNEQKKWILQQFQFWQAPIRIKSLIEQTPAQTILRTDICKVKDVTSFPWHSQHKNIVILGDAANATAPNLAQGAGLAIESAWDFISMVNLQNGQGLQQYLTKRKKRASTVQYMADMVARIGQLPSPYSSIRTFSMRYATFYLQSIQQRIFEEAVSHSVGGDALRLYWMPPNIPSSSFHQNIRQTSCLISQIMSEKQFNKLPKITRDFRASVAGHGAGKVNVQSFVFASILGLPQSMRDRPFGAYCETFYNKDGTLKQKWTRVFGEGQVNSVKYSTIHRSTPHLGLSKTGLVLTETLGLGPDIFRFGYSPQVINDTIYYKSLGLWLRNYKLPIPKFLLPSSEWSEKQTMKGWEFDGKISLPKILGGFKLMKYSGYFEPNHCSKLTKSINKKVVVAGGTGMIGSQVVKAFFQNGWTVSVLGRSSNKKEHLPYVKYYQWDPSQYYNEKQIEKVSSILQNSDLIINLAGQNPGSGLWTSKLKARIMESRLNSIKLIGSALQKCGNKTPFYLQASAAGIYGDAKQQILEDDHLPGIDNTFRTQTCKQIERLTRELCADAGILRIGHVFSSDGGLLPSLELASKMRACRFGRGGQYVPWIHIEDLANSLVHIAQKSENYRGKSINIASPNHKTYDEILKQLAKNKNRKGCIIPVPEKLIRLFLGQISSVILDSQRMHPKLLLESGFSFKLAQIQAALASKSCL